MKFRLFPFLVGGLPLGLMILGIVGMWLYFHGDDDPAPSAEVASTRRREITEEELERYRHILVDVLGTRTTDDPGSIDRTLNYLESTLGSRNLGYRVDRFALGEGEAVLASQVGGDRPREVVVVAAPYTADEAGLAARSSALALLLAVAAERTGTYSDRSIAFLLLPSDDLPAELSRTLVLEALGISGRGVVVAQLAPPDDLPVPAVPDLRGAGAWSEKIGQAVAPGR